jgi:hypothetical protein
MTCNIATNSISVAVGAVPHVRLVDVVFTAPDIDTGDVPETISPIGGLVALRSAAAVLELVSSQAADDGSPAGTGAQTVRVRGLDAGYNEIYEDFVLNGTTAVTGSKLFFRINSAVVTAAGTGKTNAGNITIRDAGAGTTRSYIAAGLSIAEVGVFTVPAGHKLIAQGWMIASRDATGASSADVEFWATKDGVRAISWSSIVSGTLTADFTLPHEWEEKTDVEVIVSRVLNSNTIVSFHGHGLLVGPNADL